MRLLCRKKAISTVWQWVGLCVCCRSRWVGIKQGCASVASIAGQPANGQEPRQKVVCFRIRCFASSKALLDVLCLGYGYCFVASITGRWHINLICWCCCSFCYFVYLICLHLAVRAVSVLCYIKMPIYRHVVNIGE